MNQRVVVTIKATSAYKAMKIARSLTNFQVDERHGAIPLGNGEFVVRGVATGPISDPDGKIGGTYSDSPIQPF